MKQEIKTSTLLLLLLLALMTGVVLGALTNVRHSSYTISQKSLPATEKIEYLIKLADKSYVDSIDNDSTVDRLCSSILSALDPHSRYLSEKEMRREMESLRGNFEGIGVVLHPKGDTTCAGQIIEGGPAEHAGVLAGDRILLIDGTPVVGKSTSEIIPMLRGERRSKVIVTVLRPSDGKLRDIEIKRDVIKTNSLAYSCMVDKQTGYIRLTQFSHTTYAEFCDAVKQLKRQGMKRMVLVLRDNGGGALEAALDICDELLPRRELIVYTEGVHQRRKEYHSKPGGLFCEGDLIVMIDEFSASASEIVAGAVQDNDRGKIVGRHSFGKGLVQQQFQLPDNSSVLLTVSRYYTPSGRCIQRSYDKGSDEYYSDFIERVMEGDEKDSVLVALTDTTPYHTAKGRIVYGGGGIYPDHVIHYKTDTNAIYYNMLVNKGLFSESAFDIVTTQGM